MRADILSWDRIINGTLLVVSLQSIRKYYCETTGIDGAVSLCPSREQSWAGR